jgi:hypothetical protein
MWSKKRKNCVNCKTTRRNHKARGFCTECYPLILRLEKTQNWNIQEPETLKNYPKNYCSVSEFEFNKIKANIILQIKKRLRFFASRERMLNSTMMGISLEYKFGNIAKLCRVKDINMFHGTAGYFDSTFDSSQMNEIFKLLIEIEESVKWKGINWKEVMDF